MNEAEVPSPAPTSPTRPGRGIHVAIVVLVALAAAALVTLSRRSQARVNQIALASSPKAVTAVAVESAPYRAARRYVGTLQPWVEAKLGPQLTSAYVDTVLVRPGAAVKRGQILATLDCRNANATSQAVAMQARALEAEQEALSHQASRVSGLLEGGFVSPNEAEQRTAESTSKQAELLSTKAKMLKTTLEVSDCILRAPFDGEVADRSMDPGAFARPGATLVTVVDRRMVRVTADVPESDFELVAPGTPVAIHLMATNRDLSAVIARRSPAADASTRTVHLEIDLPDADRRFPVGTTAELSLEVGPSEPALRVPLAAATVRGSKATLFVVESGRARKVTLAVRGERAGSLFVAPDLAPGALVVTEGRGLLADGDAITAGVAPGGPAPTAARAQASGAAAAPAPALGPAAARVQAPAAAGAPGGPRGKGARP